MNKTSIEWTDYTWNPIRARLKRGIPPRHAHHSGTFCTRISPGCTNCYASVINKRFGTGLEYTVPNLDKHEFFVDEKILAEPVHHKKPSRIFVGDMFDLWHEAIPADMIAEVLRVALKTPRHTFQFLTKRAERMQKTVSYAQRHWDVNFGPHMWFGVSIEDQERHDERAPLLQNTHCAVRFLSIEPLLEHVDLGIETPEVGWISTLTGFTGTDPEIPGIDWVICGGESGPGARPFKLEWAENLLAQCRAAGVPFFMKQLGSKPTSDGKGHPCCVFPMRDRKGGDPSKWPESLRVREFPSPKAEVVHA